MLRLLNSVFAVFFHIKKIFCYNLFIYLYALKRMLVCFMKIIKGRIKRGECLFTVYTV